MSKKPQPIDLTSDSESDQSGWENYFPPMASSSKQSKPAKELLFYEDVQAQSSHAVVSSSSVEDDDETYAMGKKLSTALSQALESAITGLKNLPVPDKAASRPKPPKQVLGLPNPKWLAMQTQQGDHKTKKNSKGKGKRSME